MSKARWLMLPALLVTSVASAAPVTAQEIRDLLPLTGFVDDFKLYPYAIQQWNQHQTKHDFRRPSDSTYYHTNRMMTRWGLNRFSRFPADAQEPVNDSMQR